MHHSSGPVRIYRTGGGSGESSDGGSGDGCNGDSGNGDIDNENSGNGDSNADLDLLVNYLI